MHPAGRSRAPEVHPEATRRSGSVPGRLVLLFGLVTALAALAFPLAPVQEPVPTYRWTATDGAAAIPLMPYQPRTLTASVTCAAARIGGDRVLLSTVPLRPDPGAFPLAGLRIATEGARLRVVSAGVELAAPALPAGDCTIAVTSDHRRTVVTVDEGTVAVRDGDVRPDVVGAFSQAPDGVDLVLTADARFQTAATPWKIGIGALCLLALGGMLLALRRADVVAARSVRRLPRGWWRPRPVDGVVGAVLGLWWIVGAVTVDDGYIAGIVRSTDANGVVGNLYRWLNAPEAPFGWFYDLYHQWSSISAAVVWLRLPSTLLGLLCWMLLSRLVLPRLGQVVRRATTPWLAAVAFLAWWIPFNLGLRPEPWVAVGMLAVFVAVERALATRRVLPLALGLLAAGVTTAVTPAGLIAFVPVFAAALPLARLLRARTDLHVLPLAAVLVAAPAAAVLLMAPDQGLAGLAEATRVRQLIGGGLAWHQEYLRYAALLELDGFQGSLARRAPVLFTMLAAVGVTWTQLGPGRPGIARGPARRLVTGFGLGLLALTLSPTKWSQHFGDLAGYGAAVLVLGLVAWSGPALRARARTARPLALGLAVVTVVAAVVLSGKNLWPYASGWFVPTFSTMAPQLLGVPVATLVLGAGGLVAAGLFARSTWRRAGGEPDPAPGRGPGPAALVLVTLVAVVALAVVSLTRVAVQRPDTWTPAADAIAALRGQLQGMEADEGGGAGTSQCGLQRLLSVETDPAAGVLPVRSAAERPDAAGPVPVDVGGTTLPGIAVAGTTTTDWLALQPEPGLPVVVTVVGQARPGDALSIEFAGPTGIVARQELAVSAAGPRDLRLPVPSGTDSVRLVTEGPAADARPSAFATLPRLPRLTPMSAVVPPGTTAVLDWPVAFLFPCLVPAPLPPGTAALPRWWVAPPAADPAANITYAPGFGGPFAGPRLLVRQQRMALYLAGDPLRDPGQLYRWVPVEPLVEPRPQISWRTVAGWHADGRTRVPGLDPVG